MICPTSKTEYFCERDWTTQIRLNRLKKIVFPRTRPRLSVSNAKLGDIKKISTDLPVGSLGWRLSPDRLRQLRDDPNFSDLAVVTTYDGAVRAPREKGLIGRRKCNASCLGNLLFDRPLRFCERRRKRATCQFATRHRSSQPNPGPGLRHSEWCADLSRQLRSGWSADPPRRPSCLQ
jgi:hypothetical protein